MSAIKMTSSSVPNSSSETAETEETEGKVLSGSWQNWEKSRMKRSYEVRLPAGFVITSFLVTILISYSLGCASRSLLKMRTKQLQTVLSSYSSRTVDTDIGAGNEGTRIVKQVQLPFPILMDGKNVPDTKYTSKEFVVKSVVRTSHNIHIRKLVGKIDTPVNYDNLSTDHAFDERATTGERINEEACVTGDHKTEDDTSEDSATEGGKNDEDEEMHEPAGQHLLIDIKNVDGEFLDSEERLAQAMIDVVLRSKLTLLSYHCHSLQPLGVSCVGVLLESHISLHTWPDEGVITVDLYTCGPNSLLPDVPIVEKLFAVPDAKYKEANSTSHYSEEGDTYEPPRMIWSHKLRGFRSHFGSMPTLATDLAEYVLDPMLFDYKKEVVSVLTYFRQIDIYDVINPKYGNILSYEKSLKNDGSYEAKHPGSFKPIRMLFLNGDLKSTSYGDAPYHEGLVHPGMFAHDYPEQVAILFGGDGAILREVLKHKSVKNVDLFETDKNFIQVSREHLTAWHDCSDIIVSAESCFDDPRTQIISENVYDWFTSHFSYPCNESDMNENEIQYCQIYEPSSHSTSSSPDDNAYDPKKDVGDEHDKFSDQTKRGMLMDREYDVIILDLFDLLNSDVESKVDGDRSLLESIYGALSRDGIMVMQLGESPSQRDPAEEFLKNEYRAKVMWLVEELGFESLHVYEESHGNFQVVSSFLVACKDYNCRSNWYASPAEYDAKVHSRGVRTRSGASPFKYFDGATMKNYHFPPKAWEAVFCRSKPIPHECSTLRKFDSGILGFSEDKFEVKNISFGENAGKNLFTTVDIPEGSLIVPELAGHKLYFPSATTDLMEEVTNQFPDAHHLKTVLSFLYNYGVQHNAMGYNGYYVESSLLVFANHECKDALQEVTKHHDLKCVDVSYSSEGNPSFNVRVFQKPMSMDLTYNIVVDRHPSLFVTFNVANKYISAGEEIWLNNLRHFL